MSRPLLVEIGTEELPPKALEALGEALADAVGERLSALNIEHSGSYYLAAPRRLAVLIDNLAEAAADQQQTQWGPPLNIAFGADGAPSKAGLAFANKNQIDPAALADYTANDGQQDKLCVTQCVAGAVTVEVLEGLLSEALAGLPIPKRMRWGSSRAEFVRPLKWLAVLFGEQTVALELLGVASGNQSRGHRFHAPTAFILEGAGRYREQLREHWVMVDGAERRALIEQRVAALAGEVDGTAVIDPALLDEVASLNEWPVPLRGQFDPEFLAVPAEALVSSMASHQKYFHVVDADGALLPYFITVANIESRDPAQVIAGNERVIRPRLADAAFFYANDLKISLETRRDSLRSVVFQAQLGSLYDKSERVAKLAELIANRSGGDGAVAARAGQLCKSDLVSDMVGEFDDLQGVMGRYYARANGESDEVASALYEQYLPRFAGDAIAASAAGRALALADRLDTITGIFAIGQPPSGSKDPFALRRASLGVLRTLIEGGLDLNLAELVAAAAAAQPLNKPQNDSGKQALTYILERLEGYYRDIGIAHPYLLAVVESGAQNPLDIDIRVKAVAAFAELPEAAALAAANKRVANILAKQPSDDALAALDTALLIEPAERTLSAQLEALRPRLDELLAGRDYRAALTALAALQAPVDAFFNEVMVNCDDLAVRANRIALLAELRRQFLSIADISQLAGS
jgi:glycyl-tRNA synthetase beta chain